MNTAEKIRSRDKFDDFVADKERRHLYERESLAFDAAELVSVLMGEKNVSKAELARRIGKTRAYVTQLLTGSRNMTMYTLADLAFALGSRVELKARHCDQQDSTSAEGKTHHLYRFGSKCLRYVSDEGTRPIAAERTLQLGA